MKRLFVLAFTLMFVLVACSTNTTPIVQSESSSESSEEVNPPAISTNTQNDSITHSVPQIYLYGEMHAEEKILDRELELWRNYYHNENMRHLFVELSYYGAEFINLWMQSDSDELLNTLYDEWDGAAMHSPTVLEFYKQIKEECPETIFHGTDVGHQHKTTGRRFLEYLETNKLTDTDLYRLTLQAIEQGKNYKANSDEDHVYRENTMVDNFIREFDNLNGESIMGIYGGAHTDFDAMEYITHSVPCMAAQLKERYGDVIYAEDLTWLLRDIEPIRSDVISVGEKEYEATYYGQQDVSQHEVMKCRDFWRLENAYDDFKDIPLADDDLPYDNYPMLVDEGQVFVIEYTLKDGSVMRMYYRSDGISSDGRPLTSQFIVE